MERQKVKKKEPSGAIFISLLRESHMSLTKIVTRLSQSNQVMQLFLSILTTASTLNSVSYYLNFFFFLFDFLQMGKRENSKVNYQLFSFSPGDGFFFLFFGDKFRQLVCGMTSKQKLLGKKMSIRHLQLVALSPHSVGSAHPLLGITIELKIASHQSIRGRERATILTLFDQ